MEVECCVFLGSCTAPGRCLGNGGWKGKLGAWTGVGLPALSRKRDVEAVMPPLTARRPSLGVHEPHVLAPNARPFLFWSSWQGSRISVQPPFASTCEREQQFKDRSKLTKQNNGLCCYRLLYRKAWN